MVTLCKLFPDQKSPFSAFRLCKHMRTVINTVITGKSGLTARRTVKIQDRINMIFFTPAQHLLQYGKAFLDEIAAYRSEVQ